MIAVKTDEVLRETGARLSGFRCKMRWQREMFTFGNKHWGHTVGAVLHDVDMVVTYGCKAVAAHGEPVRLGHSVGTILGTALKEVLMGGKCSFCTIVNAEHLFVPHFWCVIA
jgi:hypothetical protein